MTSPADGEARDSVGAAVLSLSPAAVEKLWVRWRERLLLGHLAPVLSGTFGVDMLSRLSTNSDSLSLLEETRLELRNHREWAAAAPEGARRMRVALKALWFACSALREAQGVTDASSGKALVPLAFGCLHLARLRDVLDLKVAHDGPHVQEERRIQLLEVARADGTSG